MGHSWIQTLGSLTQWKWWVTSALRMPSSPAAQGTVSCGGTTSSHTGRKLQSPLAAQRLTSLPTPRRTHRSLLSKMRSPASLAAGSQGQLHLGSQTPQMPARPCVSQSFHPLPKNEGINATRRSIHLSQKSRKTNATARTTMSPSSPRSHPAVRKTTSRALTRTVAALPIKGAANTILLCILPHLSTARKRPMPTAQPTPQVKAHGLGAQAPPEA